jgi:hypothetical protein
LGGSGLGSFGALPRCPDAQGFAGLVFIWERSALMARMKKLFFKKTSELQGQFANAGKRPRRRVDISAKVSVNYG